MGIDRAVYYSILTRALTTAGGLITVPLIITRLTSAEQGFYYTFGSIIALQVFFELGFGLVAVQLVAHEAAHLTLDLSSGASGPPERIARLSAVAHFVRRWYLVLSIVSAPSLFLAGAWFFSSSSQASAVRWMGPWAIMSLTASGMLFVTSLVSIIEGMGFVAEAIRLRLCAIAAQIPFTVLGLMLGLRLYSAPVANALGLTIYALLSWRTLRPVLRAATPNLATEKPSWRSDVLPLQWRIAVSWLSGWFIFSAMTPTVFTRFGAEEAGRFGLAIAISNLISAISSSWTSTKSAVLGQLASRCDWRTMDTIFLRATTQAVAVATAASLSAVALTPVLSTWLPQVSTRLPSPRVLSMLCLAASANQVVFAEALYLRAHKREPFLVTSLVSAGAMCLGLFGMAHSSACSIATMYAALTLLIGVLCGTIIFVYCRSSWHRAAPSRPCVAVHFGQRITQFPDAG